GTIFGINLVLKWQPAILPSLAIKIIVVPVVAVVLRMLAQPWAIRDIRYYAILIFSIAYVVVGLDRMVTPGGEYSTTAILFVAAALTTGALVPLGLIGQLITVLVGGATLVTAMWLHDGSLARAASDPGIAVAIAFLFSLVAARETERYRLGLWRRANRSCPASPSGASSSSAAAPRAPSVASPSASSSGSRSGPRRSRKRT